jgi:hypothetical protein
MGELLGKKGFAWAVVDSKTGRITKLSNVYRIYSTKSYAEDVCMRDEKVVKIELERFK